MVRLGWLSDLHLDFVDEAKLARFLARLGREGADGWIVTGDIAQADTVAGALRRIEAAAGAAVWFVLGNHDFYGGSLAGVRRDLPGALPPPSRVRWLTACEVEFPAPDLALVGDDGWADARLGDPIGSRVELSDFELIEELRGQPRIALIRVYNRLGLEAAARLRPKLHRAAASAPRVLVATHAPPFAEAAWYRGRPSDPDYLPWFASKVVGEEILDAAQCHSGVQFQVLCGHTHGSGVWHGAPNLTVWTARAAYGAPRVQKVLEFA